MNKSKLASNTFLITILIFVFYSTIVLGLISYSVPQAYERYKISQIQSIKDRLERSTSSIEEIDEVIKNLHSEYTLAIEYRYGDKVVFCSLITVCEDGDSSSITYNIEKTNNYIIRRFDTIIEDTGQSIYITIALPVTQIGELQELFKIIVLPLVGVMLVISSIVSTYVSHTYSSDIVKIRDDAKKLMDLDFYLDGINPRNDEIGELSTSLLMLSNKLETTIDELQSANSELEAKNKIERIDEKRRLVYIASISHDLKTPLTAIKGYTEGMLNNIGKYKDHTTYLQKNLESVEKIEKLIQTLIYSSSLSYGEIGNKYDYLCLYTLIADKVDEYDYLINEKNLKINIDVNKNISYFVNPETIKRVIDNLISNAVIYSDVGSEVVIDLSESYLCISNQCHDFDESSLEDKEILKAFYRQDTSRNSGGSGLGLYIVDRIANSHKIEINIYYIDGRYSICLDLSNIATKGSLLL